MAKRLSRAFVLLALSAATAALAQGRLADPTRPPDAASMTVAAASEDPRAPAGPRLQSVLISPDRKLAVIDGQTVALGGSVGDATVVQITETHVTLRRGGEVTTLELFPGVVRRAGQAVADKNKENKP